MIIRNATQVGNPIIRKKAKNVANPKTKTTKQIIKNLVDSMRYHELVGMAAPQIGKSSRIFVTENRDTKLRKGDTKRDIDSLRVFINPRIISSSKKEMNGWEGCGSVAFANLFGTVKRPLSLVVEALDENGEKFQLKAQNLLARVIQHEMDHLNGIVFTDRANTKSYMSKDEYLRMVRK